MKSLLVSSLLLSSFAFSQESKIVNDSMEYTLIKQTTENATSITLKKESDGQWHSEYKTFQFSSELHSVEDFLALASSSKEISSEQGYAPQAQIEYITTLSALFPLYDAQFETEYPSLLKLFTKEILEFLRSHAFVRYEDELFVISFKKEDHHLYFLMKKPGAQERRYYLFIDAVKAMVKAKQ